MNVYTKKYILLLVERGFGTLSNSEFLRILNVVLANSNKRGFSQVHCIVLHSQTVTILVELCSKKHNIMGSL